MRELERASFLGDGGALLLWLEAGDKLGDQPAGLLRVEVTSLLGDINDTGDDLVMALLITFLKSTASSADLDRELLTGGVSHELAGLLLHVLGAAGGFIDSPALLRSLAVTDFLHRFVALLHSLVVCPLLEGAGIK